MTDNAAPVRGRRRPRRSLRLSVVVATLLVGACSSSSDDGAGPMSSGAAATADPGETTTTAAAAAAAAGPPRPVVLDVQDLATMTMSQAELGAPASGLEFDWLYGGFESNEERARDKSDDLDAEMDDLERTGRLGGYQNMYVPPGAAGGPAPGVQRVYTFVGLFRDAAGASAYLADSTQEFVAEVGRPPADGQPGTTSRTVFATEGIGEESVGAVATRGTTDLVTSVSLRRDRVLGTATVLRNDRHDDRADVLRMARLLDQRVQEVLAGTRRGYTGPPGGEVALDALTAMPLPQAQLPTRYRAFGADMFRGGFLDNVERSNADSFDTDDDRADDQRFGRVVGYGGTWSSDFTDPPPRTRGWASNGVDLFGDASSASQWLADPVQDEHRQVGRSVEQVRTTAVSDFVVAGVADEAVGFVRRTTAGAEVDVLFRRGRLIGTVALGPPGGDERTSEATDLARALDRRIVSALAAEAPAS